MTTLITPKINLNGTGADQLLAAYETALSALRTAEAALAECAPHGRDFPNVAELPQARAQHLTQQEALATVRRELTAVYEAVQTQQDERLVWAAR
jgi:hypothetical protein